MNTPFRVTALVGSYRKGGTIDLAVDEILDAAKAEGAEVSKIYLIDRHTEFCRNCRSCTQQEGERRGACPLSDEMGAILDEIEHSDALVLASPMNFGTVTAVMKRFIERLTCFAYWPWGAPAPKLRKTSKDKLAVVVASSAMPAFFARLTTQMVGLLKKCAAVLGAKTVDVLFIGLAGQAPKQELSERALKKARRLGKKLMANRK